MYEEEVYYDDYDAGGGPHTGDPNLDQEYYRQQQAYYSRAPDLVRKFLVYFRNAVNEGLVFDLQNLYESSWPKITDDYYDKRSWPDEEEVAEIVDRDAVFMILYKELYFRHIYARVPGGPTLEQRFNSFFNYCDLFNYILSADRPVPLELPDLWLWELVDEFVYQFASFAAYRAKLQKKSPEDLENLNNNNKVWNVLCVLNVLHSLVDKSNIRAQMEAYSKGEDPDAVAGDFGRHSLYKMLGYFSLVGLSRLHSLLGDYHQSISVLENLDVHRRATFVVTPPGCQVTTAYHVSFAYMMMRRYADAIRTLSAILLYVQRTRQLFVATKTYQTEQVAKQTEQMYHLLAVCLVLHPQCVDDALQHTLRDKAYHERMYKMQTGDLQEFENCFTFACPKFLSPCPPPVDSPPEDYSRDATKHQVQVFMDEVAQQRMLPTIRSYLKLYTTLPLAKLATFVHQAAQQGKDAAGRAIVPREIDLDHEIGTLLMHLLCFKHKMRNMVWSSGGGGGVGAAAGSSGAGSGLDGRFQSGSELDFYIDDEMIHIADTKVAHRYGDFFVRKIHKLDEINRKLTHLKM